MKEEGTIGNPPSSTGISSDIGRQPNNNTMTVTLGDKGESEGSATEEEKKDTSFKYYLVSLYLPSMLILDVLYN
jgi:hypothetical protein